MKTQLAALVAAGALGAVGAITLIPEEPLQVVAVAAEPMNCGDYNEPEDPRVCGTRGFLQTSLYNVQGANQFCKWKAANPGEWNRLNGYISSSTPPTNIVTWFGASLRDVIQTYFLASGRPTQMPVNDSNNVCKTPLAPPTNITVGP